MAKHTLKILRCSHCARGQLNNEGGGKLYEIKRSGDKTGIGK